MTTSTAAPTERRVEPDGARGEVAAPAERADPAVALRRRLLVTAVLAVPVIGLTIVPALQFTYWQWISLTFAAPVVVWGALPLHRGAWTALRRGAATMDTLVSTGTLAALGWSLYALLLGTAGTPGAVRAVTATVARTDGAGRLYLEVAAIVTTVALAGRFAEARAARSMEPEPAGSVRWLADRAAGVAVPAVTALAVGTLGFWLGAGAGAEVACTAAVAVLVVACPGALGWAAPTALLAGARRGAELGVLVTSPDALESSRRVDTVVLDKTGTVTTGALELVAVHPADGVDAGEALRLAGSVENGSGHPIGLAIAAAATREHGELPTVAEFDSDDDGLGVRGLVAELIGDTVLAHAVLVGRPALLASYGIALPASLHGAREQAERAGHTVLAVSWDGVARAVLVVADTIKPSSADAVRRLRALGLTPMLLTGDTPVTARAVAAQVGIEPDGVLPAVRAGDEAAVVARLRGEGRVVAVVGDRVDAAAALAAADLGLALGTGSDAVVAAGGLGVVGGDPLAAVDAIRLARRTLATIKANLCWAVAGNVAALPLAAAGLLNPALAGAATVVGSVFVVVSSLRLHRFVGADHAA